MTNIRLHILTTYNSPNSLAFISPLLIHNPVFNKKGIKFYFYERISKGLCNCDILFINSKFFRAWYPKKEKEIYDVLEGFKKRIQKIIWFDTTDSTGTTQFNVMPFVDGYYKSQLLKDRSLYLKPLYGYRIFTDYYNKLCGMCDKVKKLKSMSTLLQKEHAHKLHLSWNSAMNDWGTYNFLSGELITRIRAFLPLKTTYTTRFTKVDKNRPIDINGRIGSSHSNNTIRTHREAIINKLRKFNVDISRISRKRYLSEIRNSKIGVSPFGWGEVCYRDFEIIINGALLFKADMSHLETWPPLYAENETYIPYSWDLKDFKEKLRDILNNREKIITISKKAQELYAHYLYGNGRIEFCDRVINMIRD